VFPPNIYSSNYVYTFTAGVGNSFIHPPIFSVIGSYFDKHRGLANSIFASGSSVGGLSFAPMVVWLFDEYGYEGAMLIISGILMNIFVSGSLLRPLEFFDKKKRNPKLTKANSNNNGAIENNTHEMKLLDETDAGMQRFDKSRDALFMREHSHDPETSSVKQQRSPLLKRIRTQSEGARCDNTHTDVNDEEPKHHDSKSKFGKVIEVLSRSQATLYTSGEGICGSIGNMDIPKSGIIHSVSTIGNDIEKSEDVNTQTGCCLSVKRSAVALLCQLFDVDLLKKPVFLTYMLMSFCYMSGVALMPVFIPTHAYDIGLSNTQIGTLIAMQAIIDLVAKISMGFVADRKWLKRSTILAISAFMLGTASHLVRFVDSFYTAVVLQVVSGE